MPVLGPEHDHAHPVEPDTAWSESYYFNCYDPATDTGFYSRAAVRPNEGTLDAGMSIWIPGGGIAHAGGVREQRTMVDTVLDAGPVRYEMLEPMKRWRITVDGDSTAGPVAIDVEFEALMPFVGSYGQGREGQGSSAETRKHLGKGHLEQAGRWSGTITVGGDVHRLGPEARGNRDKSWGPRRWGGPTMWRWFSINIGDDTHFGGIRNGTAAGDLHRGWVWKDGEHASVERWDVTCDLAEDGVTHVRSHVVAHDKLGRSHQLEAEVIRVEPGTKGIQPGRTIVNEGLARWTYEGREGWGISEYLHQLDDQARPVVPIE
jgi:hypothetical protein